MNTRIALLDSAEIAARQRGYDGFSYADLAHDVGIRKASIHHHFPKKADLAFDLINRYAARFAQSLDEIDSTHRTAASKIDAYRKLYRDALCDGTQLCLCVVMSAGRQSLTESVLDRLNQFHHDSVAWLQRVYSEATSDGSVAGLTNANAEAHATLALMEGAQLVARAACKVEPFDQAVAALMSRLTLDD